MKKKILSKCLAGLMSFAMAFTLVPAGALAAEADTGTQEPKPALHYDMSHANGKLTDVSGNDHDGAMRNIAEGDFMTEHGETALKFDGNSKYVEIPAGVVKGDDKESFTLEATYTDSTASAAWLFTLGTEEGD